MYNYWDMTSLRRGTSDADQWVQLHKNLAKIFSLLLIMFSLSAAKACWNPDCTYNTFGAKKLNENMMLANIVSSMTQICRFCHLYWLNEVLFFAVGVAQFAVRPCPYPPKPTMNPFCLWIIMSARLTSYIESIRTLKMELDVWDCENINWMFRNQKWCQLKLTSRNHCKI